MSFPVQLGITYLATVCVLLSYLLVTARGPWRHAKWVGKATLLLLGWMTLPHGKESTVEEPRLSEQKQMLMDRIAHHYAAQRLERESHGKD